VRRQTSSAHSIVRVSTVTGLAAVGRGLALLSTILWLAGCGRDATHRTQTAAGATTTTSAIPGGPRLRSLHSNSPASGSALRSAQSTAKKLVAKGCHERVTAVYCQAGSDGWTCTTYASDGSSGTFPLRHGVVFCSHLPQG
jgi:hypothetical protein